MIFHFDILVFPTNRKQPYSFPLLSRFCNGLFEISARLKACFGTALQFTLRYWSPWEKFPGEHHVKLWEGTKLFDWQSLHRPIGPLQDPVTYGINYTGTQMSQWDFQNKGKSGWTDKSSFVLEVPLRHLRPSVIYSLPCDRILQRAYIVFYYMASSASGQDDPNCAMWLATRAGKMEPSCPLGTTRCIPQEKPPRKPYNKSFIDQVCSVKMAGYWPRSFFASLLTSTSSRSINTQKKNLANIQPSWPHTWSVTHTYSHFIWLNGSMSLIRAETERCDIAGFSKVTTY